MAVPSRRVHVPAGYRPDGEITVFVGIYGESWTQNAIMSLESQAGDPVQVLVAVNGPSARALEDLREWQASTRHYVTIVQNERNLGPLGSWYLNRDLLTAPWVALMHQDDVYLPNHLTDLLDAAQRSPEHVVAVFGAMDGMGEDGRRVAAPPMDNQLLDMAPTAVTLPAILRRHPLPTPAVMLRNPQGFVDDLAWYDSGAPDSEWFARLACRGTFRVLDTVTMRYRLSPGGESQSTGWHSRAWQWAQSLDRLIHSDDFAKAIGDVPLAARNSFAQELLAAIPARYSGSPIFRFLAFAAAQQMATSWHYEAGPATDLLAKYLAADPGSAAARNLAGITGSPVSEHEEAPTKFVDSLLGEPPTRGRIEASGRAAYRRLGHLLPRHARMGAYRLYDRLWAHRGAR